MSDWLSSTAADRLTLTLLHFLWQGALIGLGFRGLLAAVEVRSARMRYAAALLALGAMAICPLATFAVLCGSDPAASALQSADSSAALTVVHGTPAPADRAVSPGDSAGPATQMRGAISAWQPCVLFVWLAGVSVLSARLAAGVLNLVWLRSGQNAIPDGLARRSRRLARSLGLRNVRVRESVRVGQAAAVGFFRPVVLLPASWLAELPPDVLEAVIAHELAHVRRFDVWVNLLQRVVETLLFYHPAVWWVSNRIRRERELCCDELAVRATRDAGGYALALEQVGRMQVHGTLRLAPTFTGDGKMNLLSRIQNVLGRRGQPESSSAWLVGLAALSVPAVLAAVFFSNAGWNVARAQETEREEARESESEAAPGRAEADAAERSAEDEAGERGSADESPRGDRDDSRRSTEGSRLIESFEPQTDREAALYEMIQELQREIAALREGRAVRDGAPRDGEGRKPDGPRDGEERKPDGPRDGEERKPDGPRDGEERKPDGPRDGEERKPDGPRDGEAASDVGRQERQQARTFKAYDRDRDGAMSLEEFQGLFEGDRDRSDMFAAADGNGDESLSQEEFVEYRLQPRPQTEDGASRREREGQGEGDGPRGAEE